MSTTLCRCGGKKRHETDVVCAKCYARAMHSLRAQSSYRRYVKDQEALLDSYLDVARGYMPPRQEG